MLSLTDLQEQVKEAETIDPLYAMVAVHLDCTLSGARAYISTIRDVANAAFGDADEAEEALCCAVFCQAYVIGKRDGERAA